MCENQKVLEELFTKKYKYYFVNNNQKDPCLVVISSTTGRACMFDIGEVCSLSGRDLLKVDYLFISHTHMDHFIGFDELVRINVPQFKTLVITGPTGISQNIYHRLSSYTWNLLDKDQLQFVVYELGSSGVSRFILSNTDSFIPRVYPIDQAERICGDNFILKLGSNDELYGTLLDHGIESVGYLYKSASRFKVNVEGIKSIGAVAGKWVTDLISKIESGKFSDELEVSLISGEKRTFSVEFLYHKLIEIIPPRSFGYLTDFYFSKSNLDRISSLFSGVDIVFSESTFMDKDYTKAYLKKHLTTKQAALIGAMLRVDKMRIFHFSRSYSDCDMVESEFREFFDKFSGKDPDAIDQLIQEELSRIAKLSTPSM